MTLIEELLEAAENLTLAATDYDGEGHDDTEMMALAKALEARAAHVRAMEAIKLPLATAPVLGSEWHTLGQQDMWVKLTGSLPPTPEEKR